MARNGFKVYCSDFLARGRNQNTSRHTAAKNEKMQKENENGLRRSENNVWKQCTTQKGERKVIKKKIILKRVAITVVRFSDQNTLNVAEM